MEETKIKNVLDHKGLMEALFTIRMDGHEHYFRLYVKIGTDLRKYGQKLAEDIEYGKERERIMLGQKGHHSCVFVSSMEG